MGQHISDISSKATKTLCFLRRNLAFAPKSTLEVAYKTLMYTAPIWSPDCKSQIQQVEKVQRTAARWTYRRWRNTSSVGKILYELQWPTLEARRDQSSLLFFHKVHCVNMSIDKDKYLTLSQRTISTMSSRSSQNCSTQTYSDALKYSYFPMTIPRWNNLAPIVVAAETPQGGTLNFSSYVGSGPASTFHLKKYQEFQAPKKIEILATKKISLICTITKGKDPKIHKNTP